MKVFEILNFNREPLKRLQQAGIRIEDVEYIDLYNDYRVMLGGGEKVSYIVATLADRYHVSERKGTRSSSDMVESVALRCSGDKVQGF